MIRDISKFLPLSPKKNGYVTYGDNNKGKILGIGKIGNDSTSIENVLLVNDLKHDLLSITNCVIKGIK